MPGRMLEGANIVEAFEYSPKKKRSIRYHEVNSHICSAGMKKKKKLQEN
jgi:hypothetical protein